MKKNKKTILIFILLLVINVIFIDNVGAETYNNYSDALVSCGSVKNIPTMIPKVVSIVYNIIQIVVPIVLVIFGSLDLVKAVMGGKDDEIKKGQQTLVKRLIAAALIFFVFVAVKFVISLVADDKDQTNGMIECMECFIKNDCKASVGVGGNS